MTDDEEQALIEAYIAAGKHKVIPAGGPKYKARVLSRDDLNGIHDAFRQHRMNLDICRMFKIPETQVSEIRGDWHKERKRK